MAQSKKKNDDKSKTKRSYTKKLSFKHNEIMEDYTINQFTIAQIAKKYGVSHATMSNYLRGIESELSKELAKNIEKFANNYNLVLNKVSYILNSIADKIINDIQSGKMNKMSLPQKFKLMRELSNYFTLNFSNEKGFGQPGSLIKVVFNEFKEDIESDPPKVVEIKKKKNSAREKTNK